jgi:benzoate/toluate 1,2-dioxygenase reductase component
VEGLSQGQEGRYTVRLLGRRRLSPTTFEIELERPEAFAFAAGQGVRFFAGSQGRDYSMTSGPTDGHLSFLVRTIEGGAVSPILVGAPVGTPFTMTGPHGVFVPGESPRPTVWAATGVGIAPFLSMVRAGASGFIILHGVRSSSDLFHESELRSASERYIPCVSAEPGYAGYAGRVTGWAGEHLAPGAYDFSLCGNRLMIRDFLLLIDRRFPGSRAFTEVFF